MTNNKLESAFNRLSGLKLCNDKETFVTWIKRKATSLYKRDWKRAKKIENSQWTYTQTNYLEAICEAILRCGDCSIDSYTGERLNWSLIGQYDNEKAKKNGNDYKRLFDLMPSIDHINAEPKPEFAICSWKTNDIKSNLTLEELKIWCDVFLRYQRRLTIKALR